jgi:uncharacterized metal-binding protein
MARKKSTAVPSCASCELERPKRICMTETGKGSKGCPTLTRRKVLEAADKEYDNPQTLEFARQASIQEAECYANRHQRPYVMQPSKTRIVEICEFARTPKERIGIHEEDKIFQGEYESMCNPVYQAKLLNHEKTDLNILLGLCVGHDSLFFKFSEAPTTVLAVKDRVTGHNPLAAIYLSGTYYQKLLHR